ncbi:hypothetical protein VNO77_02473 [Canavalia gladiata]|uniref:Uncharacterized protein n=1 Tax=Canavalia gladiata TaxID=3824 RepID=A0AAN9MY29_CANGL
MHDENLRISVGTEWKRVSVTLRYAVTVSSQADANTNDLVAFGKGEVRSIDDSTPLPNCQIATSVPVGSNDSVLEKPIKSYPA